MTKVIKLLTIVLITVLVFFVSSKNSSSVSSQIWVTGSMERIKPNDKPGKLTTIELYAARGEYESFQIGFKTANNIKDNNIPLSLTVSDLESSNGGIIPKTSITFYQEHYTYLEHPSPTKFGDRNSSLGKGWYPDGLIPLVNYSTEEKDNYTNLENITFNVNGGMNQPIWVDIFVPRDTPAGLYKGKFIIASDGDKMEGEILLKVWDFELPLKPSLKSAFLLWENQDKRDIIELLKHKIMPAATIEPKDEKELIENWGLSSLRLPFWSGANVDNCSMKNAPSPQQISSTAQQYESDLLLYVYATDEIDRCTNLYQPLKQWGRNIHQAGVKHLAVMAPVPELYDYVDIWVVDPNRYDLESDKISEVLASGKEVWFYTALVQDNYSPKWQIDFSPINYRIPHGFINQSLGMTGVLYWAVDYWQNDPWQSLNYPHNGENFPGEGILLYPGNRVGFRGIVPSMRLKWIREGVEDYEYIEILKSLGYEDWALTVSRTVGEDWKHWTKNPQQLETARIKLGKKIEQLLRLKALKAKSRD